MRRFELGMSLDYVSNWGITDAVREVFQNALDEEIQNPENKWYFNYDKGSKILRIGNKLSRLSTKSLLLGCSSKRGDSSTIGQHGEGYKVATIVLLRNGCSVRVYNYNEKEVWTAKIIKSRRYKAEIGVFDVEKMGVFKSVPENSLIFEIEGISEEVYEDIKLKNLWLQDDLGKIFETTHGKVLLEDRFAGKVFVKGLYVCDKSSLTYGYDLEPSIINLDRDRGLIDSFNLQYQLGKLLIKVNDVTFIGKVKDCWDGYYIRCFAYAYEDKMQEVYDKCLSLFIDKYGDDAYPCTDTAEFNRLKKRGYNVVMVNENEHHYIVSSSRYSNSVTVGATSLEVRLKEWYEKAKGYLPKELADDGLDLIEEVICKL